MELLLIILAVVAVGGYFIWKERKHEEAGTHPLDGATKAPEPWPFPTGRPPEGDNKPVSEPLPVMPTLTAALDVNKDGKVDMRDAVAAVAEVKAAVVSVADANKDGKVDIKDAVEVVAKAKKKVTKAADLNKDGKVDINDAKEAVKKTKQAAKKAKTKVTETVAKVKKSTKSKK
jgi:Ca2+-binding EF-hand superfamily protein